MNKLKLNLAGLLFSLLMFVVMVEVFLTTPLYVAFWLQFVAMAATYAFMSRVTAKAQA